MYITQERYGLSRIGLHHGVQRRVHFTMVSKSRYVKITASGRFSQTRSQMYPTSRYSSNAQISTVQHAEALIRMIQEARLHAYILILTPFLFLLHSLSTFILSSPSFSSSYFSSPPPPFPPLLLLFLLPPFPLKCLSHLPPPPPPPPPCCLPLSASPPRPS